MEEVKAIDNMQAPFGKEIEFQQVRYENDFVMIRIRIREGKRFTTIDLDPDSARRWLSIMQPWIDQNG